MDVVYNTKKVEMKLLEENLFNVENYELLRECIDKKIGETHPTWRFDFVIADSSNGNVIVGADDMSQVLKVYKDSESPSSSSLSSS